MLYESTSIDPLKDHDLYTEHLAQGAHIVRNRAGEVVQTADALGIRRDYGREALTRKLLLRKLGVWSKLEGACLDASGTLFYRKGDLEIQERLNGVHIHTNKQTGVMIQTDHVNHCEIMRQANGELWKREVNETHELFEMWMNSKLSFRTQTYFEPTRCQAKTPCGEQALIYVNRLEQSWSNGLLTREKYSFRNPLTNEQDVTLTLPVEGKLMTVRYVQSVVTTFKDCRPDETVYHLNGGNVVRTDIGGVKRELPDVERIRQFTQGDQHRFAFGTVTGAESVFTAR